MAGALAVLGAVEGAVEGAVVGAVPVDGIAPPRWSGGVVAMLLPGPIDVPTGALTDGAGGAGGLALGPPFKGAVGGVGDGVAAVWAPALPATQTRARAMRLRFIGKLLLSGVPDLNAGM